MSNEEKEQIINELQKRIDNANNLDELDVVFELEMFLDWFIETVSTTTHYTPDKP